MPGVASAYAEFVTSDPLTAVPFLKGEGTGNDFVILPDPEGKLDLTPAQVSALCDRRFGIGGDGVLRVVESANDADAARFASDARWFMDYRNSDGSTAEMCGNGARVFGRYLVHAGLAKAGDVAFATRAGIVSANVPRDGDVSVDMGRARGLGDVQVSVSGRTWPAVGVAAPNPHAVVIDDVGPDLDVAPSVGPAGVFPHGANVEFVQIVADDRVRMRVHERGVGPTLSCGTGACAVAWVMMERRSSVGDVWVEVPGGLLRVSRSEQGSMILTGPAVLVAQGMIFEEWWRK